MIYYSLNQLKSTFGPTFDWDNAAQFIEQSKGEETTFLMYIQQENASIFLDWIQQLKGLEDILLKGSTKSPFNDSLKLLDHSFSFAFKKFVTPFLAPRILKEITNNQFSATNTYVVLLDTDSRPIIEDKIYQHIAPLFDEVRGLRDTKVSEETLILATQKPVNDDVIAIINSFSRQSYALKLKYVDAVLTILNAKSCTLRLANWNLKQLEKLTLNPEHHYKINDLRNDLRIGKFTVQNTNTRKGISVPIRSVLMILFIVGILSFVAYIILYKPWSNSDKPQIVDNSSFTSFTKEERKQLDSLLRVIQPARKFSDDELDLGTYIGEELELVLRVPFKNEIAEQYYDDLMTYAQNYDGLKADTCIEQSSEKLAQLFPTNMTPIIQKAGGKTAYFKNESDYDVQIVVFRNFLKSTVYFGRLAQGKTTTIQLEIGDWFIAVPGKFMKNYSTPTNYSGESPSQDFNVAFCAIDVNFAHGINTSYTLNSNSNSSYKFLLVGSPSEQFEVVDIYGVLSEQ